MKQQMETGGQSKFFLILGGLLGFAVAFVGGVAAKNDQSDILFSASIGTVVGALLMKGLIHVVTTNVRAAQMQKQMELRKKMAAEEAAAAAAANGPQGQGAKAAPGGAARPAGAPGAAGKAGANR